MQREMLMGRDRRGGQYRAEYGAECSAEYLARAEVIRVVGWPDACDLADIVADFGVTGPLRDGGLVWRYPVEREDPIRLLDGDRLVVDLSVWRSYADAWRFAYRRRALDRTRRYAAPAPDRVLWWVSRGEVPCPEEAVLRLEHLRRNGPGPVAFTFRSPVPPPSPSVPVGRRDANGLRDARELCAR